MDNLKTDKSCNWVLILGIVFSAIYIVANILSIVAYSFSDILSMVNVNLPSWSRILPYIPRVIWVLVLVFLGLYLGAIKLKTESILIYAVVVCSILSLVFSLIQLVVIMNGQNNGLNYQLISLLSVPVLILDVVQIILFFIVGALLLLSKNDNTGSLKPVGVSVIICAILSVCSFFVTYFLIPIATKDGAISIENLLYINNCIGIVGFIIVGAILLYSFVKGYNYFNTPSVYDKKEW